MILMNKLKETEIFTYSELQIVEFILENPKLVTEVTIEKLADMTFSSPSSVVRLCKKLGMKGYADFKIKLASEVNSFSITGDRIRVDIPVGRNDSKEDIAKSFLNLHYQALLDTYNTLDLDGLQKIADAIYNADAINLRGVGESLLIAEDFHIKLRRLGMTIFSDAVIGHNNYENRKIKKQVALIVSHYADRYELRSQINEFHEFNIKVILLCANKNSPLLKMADYVILLDNEEDRSEKLGSFASRTAMAYVLDCIYAMLFLKDYQRNIKGLYDGALRIKRRMTYIQNFDQKK